MVIPDDDDWEQTKQGQKDKPTTSDASLTSLQLHACHQRSQATGSRSFETTGYTATFYQALAGSTIHGVCAKDGQKETQMKEQASWTRDTHTVQSCACHPDVMMV
eukprot:6464513-Amphidinium_carterae.2